MRSATACIRSSGCARWRAGNCRGVARACWPRALAVLAFGLVAPLGLASVAFLAGFLALQGAYTFALKHVVLVDVLAIAALFVIRAAAGAVAVDVRISPWLLLVTALLALFLALAKRRSELAVARVGAARPRRATRYRSSTS